MCSTPAPSSCVHRLIDLPRRPPRVVSGDGGRQGEQRPSSPAKGSVTASRVPPAPSSPSAAVFKSARGQPPRPSGFVQFILCVVLSVSRREPSLEPARHIRCYSFSAPRIPQLWYPPTIGKCAALQQTPTSVETAPDILSEKPYMLPCRTLQVSDRVSRTEKRPEHRVVSVTPGPHPPITWFVDGPHKPELTGDPGGCRWHRPPGRSSGPGARRCPRYHASPFHKAMQQTTSTKHPSTRPRSTSAHKAYGVCVLSTEPPPCRGTYPRLRLESAWPIRASPHSRPTTYLSGVCSRSPMSTTPATAGGDPRLPAGGPH